MNEILAVPPSSAPAQLELARNASAIVLSTFSSINMYSTADGLIVSEGTIAPGCPHHGQHLTLSDTQQMRLGILWERAIERMDHPEQKTTGGLRNKHDRIVEFYEFHPLIQRIQNGLELVGSMMIGDYRRELEEARNDAAQLSENYRNV